MERGMDRGINCVTMWMVSAPSQEKLILTQLALQVCALIHLTAAVHLKALLPLLQKQTLCKIRVREIPKAESKGYRDAMRHELNFLLEFFFFFLPSTFLCNFQRLVMCWEWENEDAFWCFTLVGVVNITDGVFICWIFMCQIEF